MKTEELAKVLEKHKKWLADLNTGIRANLCNADLRGANLRGANLRWANLLNADLLNANLRDADLCWANLRGAILRGADLRGANLRGANLRDADLCEAILRGAYLHGCKNIPPQVLAELSIPPETGSFECWKKCRNGVIVKLLVPAESPRSSGTDRKCRAKFVKVLEVIGETKGASIYDYRVLYRAGETVHCDKWNEDRWATCGGGIHFFLTRVEAENYTS